MLRVIELRCGWNELKDWDIIGVFSDSKALLEYEILRLESVGWDLHIAYKVQKHGGIWGAVMMRDVEKWDRKIISCMVQDMEGIEEVVQQALPGQRTFLTAT